MNFFKLYIGDYQRDTAHLSLLEHGAYHLMLQHFYATERPLPTGKALHRMLRAQDKEERDAIDSVAAQFWLTTDHGLVNARAQDEITKAGTQASTNRDTALAREAARRAARGEHEQSTNRDTKPPPRARVQTPDTRHHSQSSGSSIPHNAREPESVSFQFGEQLQQRYPKFPGRQQWMRALHHAANRVEIDGLTYGQLLDAVDRYAAYVAAGGVSNPKYVLRPENFFSAEDKPWLQPWGAPASKSQARQDENVAAGLAFLAEGTHAT